MTGSKAIPDGTSERSTTAAGAGSATGDPGRGGSRGDDLSPDVVFDILKNRRRRDVMRYLHAESETTTLSDLAEHIAAKENEKTVPELTSSERKRVYVCLYQCHLPKMADAGAIDYDADRGQVVLADDPSQFTQYLDFAADEPAREWPTYYLALALVGGVIFVAQRLVLPIDALSGLIMGIVIGLFVNIALEHAYKRGVVSGRRPSLPRPWAAEAN